MNKYLNLLFKNRKQLSHTRLHACLFRAVHILLHIFVTMSNKLTYLLYNSAPLKFELTFQF